MTPTSEFLCAAVAGYEFVKENIVPPEVRLLQEKQIRRKHYLLPNKEPAACACREVEGSKCALSSRCPNVKARIACPASCGSSCRNNPWANNQFIVGKKTYAGIGTYSKGLGLFASSSIDKNEFVGEYTGNIIPYREDAPRDEAWYYISAQPQPTDLVIDAHKQGSALRLINHSCQPNCEAVPYVHNGLYKVVFVTIKEIGHGEEITMNYSWTDVSKEDAIPCLCQAPNCTGFIGTLESTTSESETEEIPKTREDFAVKTTKNPSTSAARRKTKVTSIEVSTPTENNRIITDQPAAPSSSKRSIQQDASKTGSKSSLKKSNPDVRRSFSNSSLLNKGPALPSVDSSAETSTSSDFQLKPKGNSPWVTFPSSTVTSNEVSWNGINTSPNPPAASKRSFQEESSESENNPPSKKPSTCVTRTEVIGMLSLASPLLSRPSSSVTSNKMSSKNNRTLIPLLNPNPPVATVLSSKCTVQHEEEASESGNMSPPKESSPGVTRSEMGGKAISEIDDPVTVVDVSPIKASTEGSNGVSKPLFDSSLLKPSSFAVINGISKGPGVPPEVASTSQPSNKENTSEKSSCVKTEAGVHQRVGIQEQHQNIPRIPLQPTTLQSYLHQQNVSFQQTFEQLTINFQQQLQKQNATLQTDLEQLTLNHEQQIMALQTHFQIQNFVFEQHIQAQKFTLEQYHQIVNFIVQQQCRTTLEHQKCNGTGDTLPEPHVLGGN